MEIGGKLHRSRSDGYRWTRMDVLWKELEVCDTRGSRWKYVGMETHGSFRGINFWKLQLMEAKEASTTTDRGTSHVFPWKLPPTSMEVNLLPPTSMEHSMEVNLLIRPLPHLLPTDNDLWLRAVILNGVLRIISVSVLLVVGGAWNFSEGLLEYCAKLHPNVDSFRFFGVVVMSITYFTALGSVGFWVRNNMSWMVLYIIPVIY